MLKNQILHRFDGAKSRDVTRRLRIEPLEDRRLLVVGPFLHVHNTDQLAVVDAADGRMDIISRMSGFLGADRMMNDIAFGTDGRLFGVAQEWLYEIHPVTGILSPMGVHGIDTVTSLVVKANGRLQAMGGLSPDLFEMTVDDTSLVSKTRLATLSDTDGSTIIGSRGDITYYKGDLLVATTDDRLLRYRFDVSPTRPRVVQEVDLLALGIRSPFGLATVDNDRLFVTAGTSVFDVDISNSSSPSAIEVPLFDQAFGTMRGAAYYGEAGGPVPVGTVSGIKWHDRNRDGVRQNNEPSLSEWRVYIDSNLNGVFDTGEPVRRTDDTGRFYFFGLRPGLYTIDEIILEPALWQQTHPTTAGRNLVGDYSFIDRTVNNQLTHDFGLPDLINSFVSLTNDGANFTRVAAYLEMPWALGASPFTIVLDGTYSATIASDQYIVSQLAGPSNSARDFQIFTRPGNQTVTTSFCNREGVCQGTELGVVDNTLHRYAITWDGGTLGAYFDGQLVERSITGTLPAIDGDVVRFGDPSSLNSSAGLRGVVNHIQIFNRALTEIELDDAFQSTLEPNAYSILLDGSSRIDSLDFGNAEPIVTAPEIQINWGAVDGDVILSGDTVDLGSGASTDIPPNADIYISNTGTEPLEISDVVVTTGFDLFGAVDSPLNPGESTSFQVIVSNLTQGDKTGVIGITSNDDNESPFIIRLKAEIFDPDIRPREILVNSIEGDLVRYDPNVGGPHSMLVGSIALTDIALDPRSDRVYGIDSTSIYEVDLTSNRILTLFAHGVQSAAALGFAPDGRLFAAGLDVYEVDLQGQATDRFADGGTAQAGDIAFLGTRMLMSTLVGDLYEIDENQSVRLGSLGGVAMKGMVATDTNTLYGFADDQGYVIDVDDLSITPQFDPLTFTAAGATYLPTIEAHNQLEPLDVNGDGLIIPFDALLVINELNAPSFSSPTDGKIVMTPVGTTLYPDVNKDGFITPSDVLLIINYLNDLAAAIAAPSIEGESDPMAIDAAIDDSLALDDEMLDDVVADVAGNVIGDARREV